MNHIHQTNHLHHRNHIKHLETADLVGGVERPYEVTADCVAQVSFVRDPLLRETKKKEEKVNFVRDLLLK